MNFAERLAELMDENGFSKYKLAKLLDRSQSTVANWVNGTTEPTPATKRVIANAFKVSVEYLNGETDIKKEPADLMADGLGKEKAELIELIKTASDEEIHLLLTVAKAQLDVRKSPDEL